MFNGAAEMMVLAVGGSLKRTHNFCASFNPLPVTETMLPCHVVLFKSTMKVVKIIPQHATVITASTAGRPPDVDKLRALSSCF